MNASAEVVERACGTCTLKGPIDGLGRAPGDTR